MARSLILLFSIVLIIGLLWGALVILLMAQGLMRPRRMSAARALVRLHRLTPGDLGLEYEEKTFIVRDESNGQTLSIAAWWLPHPTAGNRCAILIHGYSDAKVGGIAWAPLFRSLGYNVLAVDLRAHGESEGKYTTAGFYERHDISQVIDQLRASHPSDTRQILLFGASLGAAVTAATAEIRDDLQAVILESPYATFRNAAFHQGDRLGTPGPFFQESAVRLAQFLAHADFDAVSPIKTIRNIRCPVLLIQSGDDPFLSEADLEAVRAAVELHDVAHNTICNGRVCWHLPGCHHIVGMTQNPAEYRKKIEEFLSQIPQQPLDAQTGLAAQKLQ
jgi:uncharacterized protein